jgi:hypothetical protein
MKHLVQLLLLGALLLLPVKGGRAQIPEIQSTSKLLTDGLARTHTVTSTRNSA